MTETYTKARFWKCALQVNPAGYIEYRGENHGLTEEQYNRYLGSLELLDPDNGVRPSRLGSEALLRKVDDIGGFSYAAHCTDDNGVLFRKLNHIWKCDYLKAAQISGVVDDLKNDEGQAFRQILLNKDPNYKRDKQIAIINAKLDNAFIADRIVAELRSAKIARQFLFATHNANIPVFGDAEWIGVFKADENRALMPSSAQGAIDLPKIQKEAAKILGGRFTYFG